MNSKIKVLHLTTHNEVCGIAKYQEQFMRAMESEKDIENVVFDVSPNKTRFMTKEEYKPVLAHFTSMLEKADMLHIQHELSFYKHTELSNVMQIAHKMHKPVIITIHTALTVEYKQAKLLGYLPKYFILFLRELKRQKNFEKVHLNPLKQADLILVHNNATKISLESIGINVNKIKIIKLPIPNIRQTLNNNYLADKLNIKAGDILICTIGFVSKTKGIDQAIKALRYLPENFKLAIIGGSHPDSKDKGYLDELTDYIADNNLKERVYITGYIEDDNELNDLISECSICVYPYDGNYYSYVSSAALNNGLANNKAVITYPIPTFDEINNENEVIKVTKSPNYYELAKEITHLDIKKYSLLSKEYANKYSYNKEAAKMAEVYRKMFNGC